MDVYFEGDLPLVRENLLFKTSIVAANATGSPSSRGNTSRAARSRPSSGGSLRPAMFLICAMIQRRAASETNKRRSKIIIGIEEASEGDEKDEQRGDAGKTLNKQSI